MDRAQFTVSISGHAGYAPHGQDIVCAAASILAATLRRALMGITGFAISDDGEHMQMECHPTVDKARYVLDAFDIIGEGFELLAASYPENVGYRCVR